MKQYKFQIVFLQLFGEGGEEIKGLKGENAHYNKQFYTSKYQALYLEIFQKSPHRVANRIQLISYLYCKIKTKAYIAGI